jgi:hypothetical protein
VKSISLGAVVSAAFLIFADSVCAADARVKVALLDGAPVYHWRVFKSRYSDDIDRALVLREFKRRGFTLPDKFVEKALQQEIAEKYNGDKTNLERSLQRAGMTMVITGNSSPRNSCYRLCPYLSRSTRTATIRPLRGQNGLLRYAKGQTSKYYDDKCIVGSVA